VLVPKSARACARCASPARIGAWMHLESRRRADSPGGVRGVVVAAWLDEDAQAELKHGSRRAVRGHLGLLHLKADLERRECLASVVEMSIVSASAAMRSRAALPFRESRRVRGVVIFVHMMLVAVS
jgi:hypothetical protein